MAVFHSFRSTPSSSSFKMAVEMIIAKVNIAPWSRAVVRKIRKLVFPHIRLKSYDILFPDFRFSVSVVQPSSELYSIKL